MALDTKIASIVKAIAFAENGGKVNINNAKAGKITSYYDNLEVEDGMEYIFNDYLIYRSASKTGMDRETAMSFRATFLDNINKMSILENKKDDSKSSFSIDKSACI